MSAVPAPAIIPSEPVAEVLPGWRGCERCGQLHPAAIAQRCDRCAAELAPRRTDPVTTLALSLAALILYAAALVLPIATAAKFGERHTGYLASGIASLWRQGNWPLALLVWWCGLIAPLLLTGLLGAAVWSSRVRERRGGNVGRVGWWLRWARRVERWSMPEVQLLGVIVACIKLSSLVATRPAAGLGCYAFAALLTVWAWRGGEATATAGKGAS